MAADNSKNTTNKGNQDPRLSLQCQIIAKDTTTLRSLDWDRDRFDIVVMLQPTSPFRRTHHLFECLDMLIEGQRDSVITVSEADPKFSPLKQLRIVDDNLEYFDSRGAQIIARQQLEKMFFRNGSVYALTRDCVQKKKQVITEQTGAVVCNDPLVNIDTEEDILFAEYLLSSGKLKSFS